MDWSGAWLASPVLEARSKLTAPDFERLARTPWPIGSLASSGIRDHLIGIGVIPSPVKLLG